MITLLTIGKPPIFPTREYLVDSEAEIADIPQMRDGNSYAEAIDPEDMGRIYTEGEFIIEEFI